MSNSMFRVIRWIDDEIEETDVFASYSDVLEWMNGKGGRFEISRIICECGGLIV